MAAAEPFQTDVIPTNAGPLEMTFIGHGTLMFSFGGKVIHVDPVAEYADYSKLPKADLILVTHQHRDHLDPKVVEHAAAARDPDRGERTQRRPGAGKRSHEER